MNIQSIFRRTLHTRSPKHHSLRHSHSRSRSKDNKLRGKKRMIEIKRIKVFSQQNGVSFTGASFISLLYRPISSLSLENTRALSHSHTTQCSNPFALNIFGGYISFYFGAYQSSKSFIRRIQSDMQRCVGRLGANCIHASD